MPENIEWALQKGINNEDGNLRDLAVSILEKSDYKLSENNLKTLQKLLETDENLYVRFRAAFALFNKGDKSEIVIKKLKEACENEDVKEIAEKYLDKLKS